jgi:hypothetical protein
VAITSIEHRWILERLQKLAPGTVRVGDELISHAQLKRTGYYSDFARQYDMVRVVGGVLEAGPRSVSVVSVNGGERRQPCC